jgi:hypothetical protein
MTGTDPTPGVIFVSRKGSASTDIDADPAFRAIYEYRRERTRQWQRLAAAAVLVVVVACLAWLVRRAGAWII